ncbi:unnamed protein product [Discosporangium mesarthrocarpum]
MCTTSTKAAPVDTSTLKKLETLELGTRLKGVVVSEYEGRKGKKAWVRVPVTRPASGGSRRYVDAMIRLDKEEEGKSTKLKINSPVTVYVNKVKLEQGRLEASLKPCRSRIQRPDPNTLVPLSSLKVGQEIKGNVVKVTDFAVFVDCGVTRPGKGARMFPENGFLARVDIPDDVALSTQLVRKDTVKMVIREGQELRAWVKHVIPAMGRFRLTLFEGITPDIARAATAERLKEKRKWAKRKKVTDLEVGAKLYGFVVKTLDFGFLVDVGAKSNGLVHVSSVSEKVEAFIENMQEFASPGDKMHVTVLSIEGGRLSLGFIDRDQDVVKLPNRRTRRALARGDIIEMEQSKGKDKKEENETSDSSSKKTKKRAEKYDSFDDFDSQFDEGKDEDGFDYDLYDM